MKPARIAAILMLAFLFGGSSAEVAVQAKDALARRHREASGSQAAVDAVDVPEQVSPQVVRFAVRVVTWREPSGGVRVALLAVRVPAPERRRALPHPS